MSPLGRCSALLMPRVSWASCRQAAAGMPGIGQSGGGAGGVNTAPAWSLIPGHQRPLPQKNQSKTSGVTAEFGFPVDPGQVVCPRPWTTATILAM